VPLTIPVAGEKIHEINSPEKATFILPGNVNRSG
jgi:hypothetical protein